MPPAHRVASSDLRPDTVRHRRVEDLTFSHDATLVDSCNTECGLHVVVFGKRIAPRHTTALTSMDYGVFRRGAFERYRLHHTRTHGRPIAWIHIHMLAPET